MYLLRLGLNFCFNFLALTLHLHVNLRLNSLTFGDEICFSLQLVLTCFSQAPGVRALFGCLGVGVHPIAVSVIPVRTFSWHLAGPSLGWQSSPSAIRTFLAISTSPRGWSPWAVWSLSASCKPRVHSGGEVVYPVDVETSCHKV